jgi:hypothetical protein
MDTDRNGCIDEKEFINAILRWLNTTTTATLSRNKKRVGNFVQYPNNLNIS